MGIGENSHMKLINFLNMYDNWNGTITVNDEQLKPIISGSVFDIVNQRKDLHNKEVVSFGFYDGELTVRVK